MSFGSGQNQARQNTYTCIPLNMNMYWMNKLQGGIGLPLHFAVFCVEIATGMSDWIPPPFFV